MRGSPARYAHSIPETGRIVPSSSRWSSIELDYNLLPQPSSSYDYSPSGYTKSYDFNLIITDKAHFKRFIYISSILVLTTIAASLLVSLWPSKHEENGESIDFQLALSRALLFFDAQKSGVLPMDNPVRFRGNSGMQDGNSRQTTNAELVGGFYDSGNNVKFSFTTAYTITLLSWTVIEYHKKYEAIGELDHVKEVIRWGSDYLLKVYDPSNSTSILLYSQVGSSNIYSNSGNDVTCWQKPEDMTYTRPVSTCGTSASDLAGEIVAAMAAASMVFSEDESYSTKLVRASESLFEVAKSDPNKKTYTEIESCGGEARNFYNSSDYHDELVWGGTWLFLATGKSSYLRFATEVFELALQKEAPADNGIFYWNNKLAASAVLFTRIWYFHDPGYPYDETLKLSSDMTGTLMCYYISLFPKFNNTPGGLILLKPTDSAPLQLAATAAFLTKIFSDYLDILQLPGASCMSTYFSTESLQNFAKSQVDYILGQNPAKMSYLVGFGDHFPQQVHHRGASIPWDGRHYNCSDGEKWRLSESPNPNVLIGAMVAGPGRDDKFLDKRNWPAHTEPTISGNAGLIAALIALVDHQSPLGTDGLDREGIFVNINQMD